MWLRAIAKRYLNAQGGTTRFRQSEVTNLILSDPIFQSAWRKEGHRLAVVHWIVEPQQTQPVAEAAAWRLPQLGSLRELADWSWLTDGQLEWFADLLGLAYKTSSEALRHYRYRVLQKSSGGFRLIESPKKRLKEMQRQILEYILDPIPKHPAVHGFVKGRSTQSFAAPHTAKAVVLRLDLASFFPTFSGPSIQAFFRTLGYSESVADMLGGICTTTTPLEVCQPIDDSTYRRRHLPQGSPTSPTLANLCFYRMDCGLSGLAKSSGAQYTRYADDLAFSGDEQFARRAERFATSASAILLEAGFDVNHRKTRVMRRGVRQHLAGLVVNKHLNFARSDSDTLKATLHNCTRFGPQGQNRNGNEIFRAHLEGRVTYVESINETRGASYERYSTRLTGEITCRSVQPASAKCRYFRVNLKR